VFAVGGELDGALGDELGAELRSKLGLLIASILRNPLGEDTVGAPEGRRLEDNNTLWVEMGVAVRSLVGGKLGGALGDKLGAALRSKLGLALGSILGEATVGASEGARLEVDNTLWVELGVAVRLLLADLDGAELGLELRLGAMFAFVSMVVLGSIVEAGAMLGTDDVAIKVGIALGASLALAAMLSLETTDVEIKVGIALGASLALAAMLSLETTGNETELWIALSALLGLATEATLEEASLELLGFKLG
jgi:hypothetical protein